MARIQRSTTGVRPVREELGAAEIRKALAEAVVKLNIRLPRFGQLRDTRHPRERKPSQ